MKPHLVRWHKEYADKGLVIIDVDHGQRDTLEKLQKNAEKGGIAFPILWDSGGKNCATYGIKGFPAAFLVGVDGTVIWEGFPLPKVESLEKTIQAELAKVKKEEPAKEEEKK